MTQALFVVNAGSSSIKFKIYGVAAQDHEHEDLDLIMGGQVDGIGSEPRLKVKDQAGAVLVDDKFPVEQLSTLSQAQTVIADWVTPRIKGFVIIGIGHRVVHGGSVYSKPVLVDDEVMHTLESFIPLAPLHQLGNLDPIRILRERRPDLPQVACFDTAFHHGHPELSDRFALPRELYEEGVRRYGFHGLSYEYVHGKMEQIDPGVAQGRLIIAHLGSGASICCLFGGRSIETTMGFTALDGLPMGTRSGTLDPGVVLHLIEQKGMKPEEVGNMLYKQSGLLGLSGISNDVRELLASDRQEANMAIDFFCQRVAQSMASLAVTINGLDGLVFTAGIGENAPEVRRRVIKHLNWSGLFIDDMANEARLPGPQGMRIEGAHSRVPIYVIPTDEEKMIGLHTLRLLRLLKKH
ncbi:acetate/propionate family kinase [Beijerinckia mobilis]|uniref:acetate/propionate family kinase n=1 Tax=Beijerinckia mobilis TaxID=231434 RepID=UPI000557B6BE|nr:acetate/propionate family kinase [Beijerinckia mobilis]